MGSSSVQIQNAWLKADFRFLRNWIRFFKRVANCTDKAVDANSYNLGSLRFFFCCDLMRLALLFITRRTDSFKHHKLYRV